MDGVAEETRRTALGRMVRGLGGALCAGLFLLAFGMVVAQWIATDQDKEGPGLWVLVAHFAAAVAALFAQRYADRHLGPPAWLAVLGVCGITFAVFWFMWWG